MPCRTWLPQDELGHGLGVPGLVLGHALVEALIRFHQAKDLEVTSTLRSKISVQSISVIGLWIKKGYIWNIS